MPGIFLNVREVQLIEGHTTYEGAWKSYDDIRERVGKDKGQKLTIPEYAETEGVPIEIICKLLKLQKCLQLSLL